MERRSFVKYTAAAGASLMLHPFASLASPTGKKIKLAQAGTGHRGSGFWGEDLIKNFGEYIEFTGVHDSNTGRMMRAQKRYGADVKAFASFDEMLEKVSADYIIVTTVDATHHEFIVKALKKGFNVITEKPMTTDEVKCKEIIDAEKSSGKKVIVAFNYRHSVHNMQLKELLAAERVGKITSVDFHWYLNVYHGADYFRRWHGRMNKGGSLWVHKATHHFDLLNWWLNSEPVEVSAYGSLDHYGKNNAFRGTNCRSCEHKGNCKFYWDMTKDARLMSLYAENEKYDGYLRDGCVWSNEIDIFDKMSAQIIYANGVTVNYSLTTYSPYEGWKIAFNGTKGRLDTWEDIPFMQKVQEDQSKKHAVEMSEADDGVKGEVREIIAMDNFAKKFEVYTTPIIKAGHGGGDVRMQRRMFIDTNDNPHHIMAGTRDGAMSILIGIAARKSIALKRPVKISELTDLVPKANRHDV
ncbi:oxidoreductase family protein [Lacibacter cauensis]|uniref:Oxidoreductase family protein n=1 Tax=Lacibacter cauensis TaxID=510947 RepID=A0A562SQM6_9BACT|nr:Gfo/Idh/MocA family oxidoreductase [Lacibacter cauensis]TWI83314.1 oxidoreductase family protein [Lacibacter cauensis]